MERLEKAVPAFDADSGSSTIESPNSAFALMIFFTCSLYSAEPSFSFPNKSSCSKVNLPWFCRAFTNTGALFTESFIASA